MEEFEINTPSPNSELSAAIERFEEMLRRNKRYFFDQQLILEIVDHYISSDDLLKATEAANLAVEQYPFSLEPWLKKSQVLIEQDKYDAALKILDKASQIEPNDINVLLMKSDIMLFKNQFQQAVDLLKQGLQHAEKDEIDLFYLEIADVYFEWNNLEKSFDYVVKALIKNPNNEYSLNRIWYLTEVTDRYDESAKIHQKIISDYPFNYSAWTNLSQAYSGLGLEEKALECCEYAIAINENNDVAYRDAGEISMSLKRYKDALEYFAKVQQLIVPDAFVLFNIGNCYEKLKDFSSARGYYQRSVQQNKNFSDGYFQIGETYTKEGEWKKAIPYFRTAMKMNENYLPYKAKLAKALLMSEYYREAGKAYAELIEHNPKNKTFWKGLIKVYLALDKPEDASFAYNQSVSYLGNTVEFDFISVAVFWANNQQTAALLALENAMSQNQKKYKLLFDFLPKLIKEPKVKKVLIGYLK